jgi:hypothetical protein
MRPDERATPVIYVTSVPEVQAHAPVNVHFVTFSGRRSAEPGRAAIVKGLMGQGLLDDAVSHAIVPFIT